MTLYKVYDKHSGNTYQYEGYSEEARKYVTKVGNLRDRVYEELEDMEKLFEAAKRTMDQIQQQISQVRVNLEATPARTGEIFIDDDWEDVEATPARTGCIIIDDWDEAARSSSTIIDWDEEADLYRIKKEVRTLKYKIPYTLIYPPVDNQINSVDNPNVIWHPRTTTSSTAAVGTRNRDDTNTHYKLKLAHPDFYFLRPPGVHREPSYLSFPQSINSLDQWSRRVCQCLKQFPRGVIIKRTLLLNCFLTHHSSESESKSDDFDDALNNLVTKGLLKAICKRSTSTVSSYWMEEDIQFQLESAYRELPDFIHFSPLPSEELEILYTDNRLMIQKMKSVKVLLLGKWHRSLPLSQHIEVTDQHLFYKGMKNLTEVKYISLRGISMIPELPQFITKFKKLQILDCKACHNLEVIPDNINKLSRTLTHLDMSECHLLDHMPASLCDLLHLQVLKGFHLGQPGQYRKSCTLQDLTKLSKLQKLHIYTSVKGFPNTGHLKDIQKFQSLRNLGISWRGCQTLDESTTFATTVQRLLTRKDSIGGSSGGDQQQFSFNLEKLNLECVPCTVTSVWLNPVVFKGLKKLYITGGKFFDLGQIVDDSIEEHASIIAKENQWTVEVLRLKHLSELKMDKSEVDSLFPKLISLEKVDCPNLTPCCDNNGIWLKSTHPYLKLCGLEKEAYPDRTFLNCDGNGVWIKYGHPPSTTKSL